MGEGGWGKPAFGGTVLRIPAEQSPNFVTGVSGWKISIDGSAEFNNLTIRGTFLGIDFVLNTLGLFLYSGVPATGNLVASITPAAGADDGHGNAFKANVTVYGSSSTYVQMLAAVAATLNIGSGDVAEVTPARLTSAIFGSGGPRFIQTILSTARVSGQNALSGLSIFLEGESVDHTFGNDLRIEGSSQTGAEGFRIALEAVDGSSSMLFSGTGVAGTMLFMDVTNNAITSGYPIRAATALGGSTPIVSSTALTLLNSWANQGGGLQQAQVIRNAQNEVHLLAVLSPAAATAAQFATIPAGLRPIGAAVEDGLGFHTAVGAGTGAFLRVATTGAASIINFAVGMGAVVVNTKIPLTTIT